MLLDLAGSQGPLMSYEEWGMTLAVNFLISRITINCLKKYCSEVLVHPSIHPPMALQPLLDLDRFFSFLIFYTVGRTPWMGDQPVARPLPTHRTTQTQNKRTQTSMP
jgi:hypothetical protein